MIRFLSTAVSRLPANWIRWIGRLQFRIPLVGAIIGWFGRKVLATEGTIRHGIGAGLRFDARHGSAGFVFGTAEPVEQEALAGFLKPGDVFYDIGANVGFFSTLAANLVGSKGKVYAFEPNPVCAAQARKNADLNQFSHVEVITAAVASSTGRTRLKFGQITGASTIMNVGDDSADGMDITTISIDDFIRERDAQGPKVVMIDAEGAELEVLRGMRKTIAAYRPIIMCEVHWLGDDFAQYCSDELAALGYAIQTLEGDELPAFKTRFHALLLPK